jgi:fructokinase
MSKFTIVGLGELLWDIFPTHKELGGAPANFAYISSLLGDEAIVASRIGTDALGDEVLARLDGLGLDTTHVQRDPAHPTGTVAVELASDGQPRFEITAARRSGQKNGRRLLRLTGAARTSLSRNYQPLRESDS